MPIWGRRLFPWGTIQCDSRRNRNQVLKIWILCVLETYRDFNRNLPRVASRLEGWSTPGARLRYPATLNIPWKLNHQTDPRGSCSLWVEATYRPPTPAIACSQLSLEVEVSMVYFKSSRISQPGAYHQSNFATTLGTSKLDLRQCRNRLENRLSFEVQVFKIKTAVTREIWVSSCWNPSVGP